MSCIPFWVVSRKMHAMQITKKAMPASAVIANIFNVQRDFILCLTSSWGSGHASCMFWIDLLLMASKFYYFCQVVWVYDYSSFKIYWWCGVFENYKNHLSRSTLKMTFVDKAGPHTVWYFYSDLETKAFRIDLKL